jgi:polar amino acid transport system permease protein
VNLIIQSLPQLLHGLAVTVGLSVAAIVGSTLVGLLVAMARTSKLPLISQVGRAYVEIFRGSPLPITLLFIYFGAVYYLGYSLNLFVAATVGLSLYHGAYVAEIFRSGIEAVHAGQREAAQVLGLSSTQTFFSVVLPQTRRIAMPPLVGQYISLVKDTSIAFLIGTVELMKVGQSIVDRTGQSVPIYVSVAVLYFIICYPLSVWVRRSDRKVLSP